MSGLKSICKLYGSMTVTDKDGTKTVWVWDYANDKARPKSEMSKEELAASEKAKWEWVKQGINKFSNEF